MRHDVYLYLPIEVREEVVRRLDNLRDQMDLIQQNQEMIMLDTQRLLAAATRATTDSASLRALLKDVQASLVKSNADLAAAVAANDPTAIAAAQADIDKAVGLLDPDSAQTEAALSANVQPAPTTPAP